MKKIGFIGCGNMGEAILAGALKSGLITNSEVIIYEKNPTVLQRLGNQYQIKTAQSNQEVALNAKLVVLAVKPNIYETVVAEIDPFITKNTVIISLAPSFSVDMLQSLFKQEVKIARTMPNTPAMVGSGMTAVTYASNVTSEERELVQSLFASCGEVVEVKEELMQAVTAVSGSSPAFIYLLIEAMADGAVELGMARKDAYKFAAQAVAGSARMVLETGKHPGELKDAVCSPGGTTIAGVVELEKNGFKGKIISAMHETALKYEQMQNANKTK